MSIRCRICGTEYDGIGNAGNMTAHLKDEHSFVLQAAKLLRTTAWSDLPGGKRKLYKLFAERRPTDWDDISDEDRPNLDQCLELAERIKCGDVTPNEPLPVEKCRELVPKQYRDVFDECRSRGFAAHTTAATLVYLEDSENHTQKELSAMFGCSVVGLRNVRDFLVESEVLDEYRVRGELA